MSIAFVCTKECDYEIDEQHQTSFATREPADVDPADQLTGHGEGHCEPKETA